MLAMPSHPQDAEFINEIDQKLVNFRESIVACLVQLTENQLKVKGEIKEDLKVEYWKQQITATLLSYPALELQNFHEETVISEVATAVIIFLIDANKEKSNEENEILLEQPTQQKLTKNIEELRPIYNALHHPGRLIPNSSTNKVIIANYDVTELATTLTKITLLRYLVEYRMEIQESAIYNKNKILQLFTHSWLENQIEVIKKFTENCPDNVYYAHRVTRLRSVLLREFPWVFMVFVFYALLLTSFVLLSRVVFRPLHQIYYSVIGSKLSGSILSTFNLNLLADLSRCYPYLRKVVFTESTVINVLMRISIFIIIINFLLDFLLMIARLCVLIFIIARSLALMTVKLCALIFNMVINFVLIALKLCGLIFIIATDFASMITYQITSFRRLRLIDRDAPQQLLGEINSSVIELEPHPSPVLHAFPASSNQQPPDSPALAEPEEQPSIDSPRNRN